MQNSHIALLVLLCLAGAIHETEAQYYSYYPYYYNYGYPYYYNYYSYYPYSYSYYGYGKRSVDWSQAPQQNQVPQHNMQQAGPQH